MKHLFYMPLALLLFACGDAETSNDELPSADSTAVEEFQYQTEQFADVRIVRYQIPGWDELSLQKKKLAYYLTMSGLAGRDIMYDLNYRHNLEIRKTLERIVDEYEGERSGEEWDALMEYTKRVWFANGIHHHYSMNKFKPGFSEAFFDGLLKQIGAIISDEARKAIFDPNFDAKKVSLDPNKDLLLASAVNFYDPDLTYDEVTAFYDEMMKDAGKEPISYGLNSKVIRDEDGNLKEEVWNLESPYGPAIEQIIYWLEKARGVAENEKQKEGFDLLIEYYRTGDLKIWDEYNIAWVQDTTSDVDYIHGFVEVYNDPKGYKGSFEVIVEVKDMAATADMKVLQEYAQWFEDNSPIMEEHKKANVVGISYNFINVVGEAGDASPSTPIGVNLPNANWIRAKHGSKSVSLGNIVSAYDKAGGSGALEEFANDEEEIERSKAHSDHAGHLHTALHEVIGHASGQLNEGVGTPKETLHNYASTLEEGRADLVALYYIMDQKMVDIGMMESLEVAKAEYDGYIRNGLMYQLRRIEPGEVIEESHMRNRQMIAKWVFEKGKAENVISREVRDGKTFFNINDYDKLRVLFGELLKEVQRIKSEGDYEAGKALVENYGVQVDQDLHAEVLKRSEQLKTAPYGGFINAKLVPVEENGEITDIKVEYPDDFTEQMMEYSREHSFLP